MSIGRISADLEVGSGGWRQSEEMGEGDWGVAEKNVYEGTESSRQK